MMRQVAVRLPEWIVDDLDDLAGKDMTSRSAVVRQALVAWFAERGRSDGRNAGRSAAKGRKGGRSRAGSRK